MRKNKYMNNLRVLMYQAMFAAPNKKEAKKLVLDALKDSLTRVKT
jgi:hypothetical protein